MRTSVRYSSGTPHAGVCDRRRVVPPACRHGCIAVFANEERASVALNNTRRSLSVSAKHTKKAKKHGGFVQTMRLVRVSHAYSQLKHDLISCDSYSWERSGHKSGLALNRDSLFFLVGLTLTHDSSPGHTTRGGSPQAPRLAVARGGS